jgi:hypothetical protein
MIKLRKLLCDSSKVKRRRRILLNMQMTFLAWVVEFLGFAFILLGIFIIGNNNNIVSFIIQIVSVLLMGILVPSTYLINNYSFKSLVLKNKSYLSIIDKLFPVPINQLNYADNNPNVQNENVAERRQNEAMPQVDVEN